MRQTALLNIVVLGFFVFLFSSLYRKRASSRLKFWIAGWICAIAHFVVLFWNPASPTLSNLFDAISISGLGLCGICFILSGMTDGMKPQQRLVILGLAAPCVAFCFAIAFDLHPIGIALGCELLGQSIALVFLWRFHRDQLSLTVPGTALILACSQWCSFELVAHQGDDAIAVVLMEIFCAYALLFAHDLRRHSAGVWTTAFGLLAWGAVFPVGIWIEHFLPSLHVEPEIWNVPKVVVAFGMIVTLFEDQLHVAQSERKQYKDLFNGNPLPMWIFDKDSTQLLALNASAERTFGWSRSDLSQLTINDLVSEHETSPVGLMEMNWKLAQDFAAGRATPGGSDPEVRASSMRFQARSGDEIIVEVTLQRVGFEDRECRLLVAKDITAQVEAHAQLIHQANHDPLTGLPNRLLLHDRMQTAIASAMRRGAKAAIICMDLDRFKQINDTLGHAAGDSCLREVANRLRQRLRSVDTAARTGGEEFMVILDDVGSLRDAERVANDLLFALSAPHVVDGRKIQLSASIGIALFPDDGEEPAQLWSMADAAMYRAKQSGGNRHRFYSRAN